MSEESQPSLFEGESNTTTVQEVMKRFSRSLAKEDQPDNENESLILQKKEPPSSPQKHSKTDEDVEMALYLGQCSEFVWKNIKNLGVNVFDYGLKVVKPPLRETVLLGLFLPKTVIGIFTNTLSTFVDTITLGFLVRTLAVFLKLGKTMNVCTTSCKERGVAERAELATRGLVSIMVGVYAATEATHFIMYKLGWLENNVTMNPLDTLDELQKGNLNPGQYIFMSWLLAHLYDNGFVMSNWVITQIKLYFLSTDGKAKQKIVEDIADYYKNNQIINENYNAAEVAAKTWINVGGAYLYAAYDELFIRARRLVTDYFNQNVMGSEVILYKVQRYQDLKGTARKKMLQCTPGIITKATNWIVTKLLPSDTPEYTASKEMEIKEGYLAISPRSAYSWVAFKWQMWRDPNSLIIDSERDLKIDNWRVKRYEQEAIRTFYLHQQYYLTHKHLPYHADPSFPPPMNPEEIAIKVNNYQDLTVAAGQYLNGRYLQEKRPLSEPELVAAYFAAREEWKEAVNFQLGIGAAPALKL